MLVVYTKVLTDVLTSCNDSCMNTNTAKVIDMNTTDGLTEYLMSLPTANLEAIAARPIWDAESAKMGLAAGMIVDFRNASAR
jgi:hypothetical protein